MVNILNSKYLPVVYCSSQQKNARSLGVPEACYSIHKSGVPIVVPGHSNACGNNSSNVSAPTLDSLNPAPVFMSFTKTSTFFDRCW